MRKTRYTQVATFSAGLIYLMTALVLLAAVLITAYTRSETGNRPTGRGEHYETA